MTKTLKQAYKNRDVQYIRNAMTQLKMRGTTRTLEQACKNRDVQYISNAMTQLKMWRAYLDYATLVKIILELAGEPVFDVRIKKILKLLTTHLKNHTMVPTELIEDIDRNRTCTDILNLFNFPGWTRSPYLEFIVPFINHHANRLETPGRWEFIGKIIAELRETDVAIRNVIFMMSSFPLGDDDKITMACHTVVNARKARVISLAFDTILRIPSLQRALLHNLRQYTIKLLTYNTRESHNALYYLMAKYKELGPYRPQLLATVTMELACNMGNPELVYYMHSLIPNPVGAILRGKMATAINQSINRDVELLSDPQRLGDEDVYMKFIQRSAPVWTYYTVLFFVFQKHGQLPLLFNEIKIKPHTPSWLNAIMYSYEIIVRDEPNENLKNMINTITRLRKLLGLQSQNTICFMVRILTTGLYHSYVSPDDEPDEWDIINMYLENAAMLSVGGDDADMSNTVDLMVLFGQIIASESASDRKKFYTECRYHISELDHTIDEGAFKIMALLHAYIPSSQKKLCSLSKPSDQVKGMVEVIKKWRDLGASATVTAVLLLNPEFVIAVRNLCLGRYYTFNLRDDICLVIGSMLLPRVYANHLGVSIERLLEVLTKSFQATLQKVQQPKAGKQNSIEPLNSTASSNNPVAESTTSRYIRTSSNSNALQSQSSAQAHGPEHQNTLSLEQHPPLPQAQSANNPSPSLPHAPKNDKRKTPAQEFVVESAKKAKDDGKSASH